MRISDWSSDVCSSDLIDHDVIGDVDQRADRLLPDGLQLLGHPFGRTAVPHAAHCPREEGGTALGILYPHVRSRPGRLDRLESLAHRATTLAHEMDFALLFDPATRLFHIGYNLSADRIDPHHYDLLASEARLASYFAIAKGDIAPEHWFHLGRPTPRKDTGLALVTWNGDRQSNSLK